MRERKLRRWFHLPLLIRTSIRHLKEYLAGLSDSGGADRMTFGMQPAGGVDLQGKFVWWID
jgi:hypothetical protein